KKHGKFLRETPSVKLFKHDIAAHALTRTALYSSRKPLPLPESPKNCMLISADADRTHTAGGSLLEPRLCTARLSFAGVPSNRARKSELGSTSMWVTPATITDPAGARMATRQADPRHMKEKPISVKDWRHQPHIQFGVDIHLAEACSKPRNLAELSLAQTQDTLGSESERDHSRSHGQFPLLQHLDSCFSLLLASPHYSTGCQSDPHPGRRAQPEVPHFELKPLTPPKILDPQPQSAAHSLALCDRPPASACESADVQRLHHPGGPGWTSPPSHPQLPTSWTGLLSQTCSNPARSPPSRQTAAGSSDRPLAASHPDFDSPPGFLEQLARRWLQ
uniref:Protein FAM117A n=1 Tax=Macrostomum lignano TaxID=282301 RepID=A0A1I8JRG1_9PLAT